MFRHIFLYRMKYYLRTKAFVFWLLLFPIILSSLFKVAFSGILSEEGFEIIDIAVVQDENYDRQDRFFEVLDNMSVKIGEEVEENTMFVIQHVDEKTANSLLEKNEVSGIIYVDSDSEIKIKLKENGISQTILKEFVDITKQRINLATDVTIENNGEISPEFLERLSVSKDYMQDSLKGRKTPDAIIPFFYTALAMTCLYGMMVGLYEIIDLQPNMSGFAVRISLTPISKMKVFLASFLAGCTTQLIIVFIVLSYIMFVLNIDFGDRYLLIIVTTIVGSFMGVTLGALLSALFKVSERIKMGIAIGFTMFCCFLAGMMDSSMKYNIMQTAPIINKINPASLITDSYYKLYYYEGISHYINNITSMILITLVAFFATLALLRRQKYDSI